MIPISGKAASDADRKEKGGRAEARRPKGETMLNVVQKDPPTQGNVTPFVVSSQNKKLGIWLDALVEKAKSKPIAQVVKLTPEMAEMLLGRNPANRKISAATVENYAHEMAGRRWVFNGEPIIVSDTGELNDGQHRCQAVIESGVSIDVLLIVGIARETRTTLDQGKTRTVGDYLAMEGNAYSNILGSAAGYIWLHRNRGKLSTGRNVRATKGEVMETVAACPVLKRSVQMVQDKAANAVGGRSILAFCHFTFSTINREDADYFLYALMNGAGLKVGDPILYVRNRLINERGRLSPNEKADLLFKAWNAWRRREQVSRLLLSADGLLPVLEG